MYYPYRSISSNLAVPLAPIIPVRLFNPDRNRDWIYELDAILDTGADVTLIPLEAVSTLRLPLLDGRVPVVGVGGAMTMGFPCQANLQLGEIQLALLEVIGCEAMAIGGQDQMIIGRDILNQFCIRFDGKRQQFSFELDEV